jgi:hypothetical protein
MATRKQILNELLDEIQSITPAPIGMRYFMEHSSVYGGYRLVTIKKETGASFGAFGGNGCESRVNFTTMREKLNLIINLKK